jgi:hypothetical protein
MRVNQMISRVVTAAAGAGLLAGLATTALATTALATTGLATTASAGVRPAAGSSFLARFHHRTTVASTVPGNGDVNPYGVAVVRQSRGRLHAGSVLVSNFNNKKNLQGTGRTIVQVSPGGMVQVFARITPRMLPRACGGVGLTTALAVVRNWVVVGDLPSANGMAATAKAGCLIVLNANGQVSETFSGHGQSWLFVTSVLNGTVAAGGKTVHRGTVLRLHLGFRRGGPPALLSVTTVGSGFPERTDPAAFVVAPTGLGLGHGGGLYVADTGTSSVRRIPAALTRATSAGTGTLVSSGGALNEPLGLAIAPNGNVLTVNGGDGRIIEITPAGHQIFHRFLDRSGSPPGSGALFGLAVAPHGRGLYFVDDAVNTLRLLH